MIRDHGGQNGKRQKNDQGYNGTGKKQGLIEIVCNITQIPAGSQQTEAQRSRCQISALCGADIGVGLQKRSSHIFIAGLCQCHNLGRVIAHITTLGGR